MINNNKVFSFYKKALSLLLFILLIASFSFAGFTIDMPSENEVVVDSTGYIYESQYYNISYTGSGDILTVDTGDANLPMSWSWEWCDDFYGVCHLPGWPAEFPVEDGDEINISYSVVMDTTAGAFSFFFKYTANSITDSIRCDFDFTADNTAVDEDNNYAEYIKVYPNPFENLTRISYDMKDIRHREINISIYNIKGELVKSFYHVGNRNEVMWSGKDNLGRDVKSGIYFYKIKTKSVNIINKIIKL